MDVVYICPAKGANIRFNYRVDALRALGARVHAPQHDTPGKAVGLLPPDLGDGPRIAFVHRARFSREDWLPTLAHLRKARFLVIEDHDDDIEYVFKKLYSSDGGLLAPHLKHFDRFDDFMRERLGAVGASHVMQVSTETLYARMQAWHDQIILSPNQIPAIAAPPRPAEGPIGLWFAGADRSESFGPLLPVFEALDRQYNLNWTFMTQERAQKALKQSLRVRTAHYPEPGAYGRYLASLEGQHIALMPLTDTAGHRAKSDLKFLEASGFGLATVASPTVYGETVRHGKTGFIANTPQGWFDALDTLLSNEGRRLGIATAAQDYVRSSRLLGPHMANEITRLAALYAHYDAFDKALDDRFAATP